MNAIERFLRRVLPAKRIPATPRGRVTPHDPDVTGNGAFKARAKPIPHVKYRVYRAKTREWEDFHEAQVKPTEGTD